MHEVVRSIVLHRLESITREMGLVLERSARSPIFAEARDFACGICSAEGTLVSQLSGIPILAAAGEAGVRAVLARFGSDIGPGDSFILNDPYHGGNHLPDIGIITPVFDRGALRFFCVSRAHHGDIGGSTPGSYNSRATEIYQEGLRIPPVRLERAGRLDEGILDLILTNTRAPAMMRSDLLAQLGANRIGSRRLVALLEQMSAEEVLGAVEAGLAAAESLVRQRVRALPDGEYLGEELFDDDGFAPGPLAIRVYVRVRGDSLTVDFSGTDPQVQGFVNSSLVTSTTAAYLGVLWALGPDIPRNGGAWRAIEVIAPVGSLVNPRPPAPMTLCTLTPAGEIVAAVLKALGPVTGRAVPAGFSRYCGPSFFGADPRSGEFYVGFAFCSLGGGGALAGRDGTGHVSPLSNFGGVRTPNIESNELQYPHLTLRHEFEPDSGGPGRHRGGPGVRYEIENRDPGARVVMFGDGMKVPPHGLEGGFPAAPNRVTLLTEGLEIPLGSKEEPRALARGDVLRMVSSGGGGVGDPRERELSLVQADVEAGLVSPAAARGIYGRALCSGGGHGVLGGPDGLEGVTPVSV
jgi:N-methylhydantoinase B